jgi:hypothetical protein
MLKVIKPEYNPRSHTTHTPNGCLTILLLIIDAALITSVIIQGTYALIEILTHYGH